MSVFLALLIDRYFGEPPEWLHPVVWIGRYLGFVGRRLPKLAPPTAFLAGAGLWLVGAGVFVGAYSWLNYTLPSAPRWLEWIVLGVLLKPLFSLRGLMREVAAVEAAMAIDLETGRRQLARIVSRNTSQLSASEVRESALESLSENLSDSLIAPLFWFALLGLPGAALYRFANTADAMWGYRGKWEWAGKWAAVVDDVLNFVPARLTALGLICLAHGRRGNMARLAREAAKTPSPNSGWPMSALALAHGIRLGKPGVYVLNPAGTAPDETKMTASLRHVGVTGWVMACPLAVLAEFMGRILHG
jgi:adenosylcobinamide-phosphate synthase